MLTLVSLALLVPSAHAGQAQPPKFLTDLNCTAGQIPKFNGTIWQCGSDVNTNTDTLGTLTCSEGQVPVRSGASQWVCGTITDDDTVGDLDCSAGQTVRFNGTAWACDPPSRFVDNGNGTITDNQTGLMWEKKLAANDAACPLFDIPGFPPSPHCAQNIYQWSNSGTAPDGSLFTDFLARINTQVSRSSTGEFIRDVCFAGHCDWRIPNLLELQTIVGPCSGTTQITCIEPIFGPIIGSNLGGGGSGNTPPYWSSTSVDGGPGVPLTSAWAVSFVGRGFGEAAKSNFFFVRAVRGAR
jgi:hypothetical protein